jgi:hypothetical protein
MYCMYVCTAWKRGFFFSFQSKYAKISSCLYVRELYTYNEWGWYALYNIFGMNKNDGSQISQVSLPPIEKY